jgi:hypothetical protein
MRTSTADDGSIMIHVSAKSTGRDKSPSSNPLNTAPGE